MAHDERDARLFAQGDNPPPRPHPATTTSYPHPSSTPQKVSPMCSVQSVTYVPTRSDLAVRALCLGGILRACGARFNR
jgi:hypothetical protein